MACSTHPWFAALAVALAACGGAPAPKLDPRDPPPAIAGRWQSACTVASPQQVFRLRFELTDRAWQVDYVAYGDAACASELLTEHVEGGYRLIARSPSVAGAWTGEFAIARRTVVPRSDAAAQFLASAQGCGRPGFAAGQVTDILAAGCAGLGAHPQAQCPAEHDLVVLERDTLRFGARPADGNLCSEDRRPTAPSPVVLTRA
jgi:hypothetical protein